MGDLSRNSKRRSPPRSPFSTLFLSYIATRFVLFFSSYFYSIPFPSPRFSVTSLPTIRPSLLVIVFFVCYWDRRSRSTLQGYQDRISTDAFETKIPFSRLDAPLFYRIWPGSIGGLVARFDLSSWSSYGSVWIKREKAWRMHSRKRRFRTLHTVCFPLRSWISWFFFRWSARHVSRGLFTRSEVDLLRDVVIAIASDFMQTPPGKYPVDLSSPWRSVNSNLFYLPVILLR